MYSQHVGLNGSTVEMCNQTGLGCALDGVEPAARADTTKDTAGAVGRARRRRGVRPSVLFGHDEVGTGAVAVVTYTLGVDLGTTYSAVAVHRQNLTEIIPLAHRALVTPSAVFVTADGVVLVGDAALRRGLVEPGGLAQEFKRRLGDPVPMLLGGTPYRAEALTALLLESLITGVVEQQGRRPERTVLTFPANWGPHKQDLLAEAIRLADVADASLLTEPEAAAIWYASAERIAPGETVAVYDLGGGTFDAAVLRKASQGFEVLGTPQGIDRLGGIDVDEAIFRHVCELLGIDVRAWAADDAARRAAARLRLECVEAKEALSADTTVTIPVALPDLHRDVRLTRAEVETMVRPVLQDTIQALREAIRSAGLHPDDIDRVLLVGGASRMPVVGDMVTKALGRPFFVDAHPKHVVALGAALAAASQEAGDAVRPVPDASVPDVPPTPSGDPEPAAVVPTVAPAVDVGPTAGEGRAGEAPAVELPRPVPAAAGVPSRNRQWRWLGVPVALVVLGAVVLVTRSGGGGEGAVDAAATTTTRLPVEGVPGGEVVDLATFGHGMPEHLDPALGPSPSSGQVVDALYDGLTTVDISDPDEPRVVPLVAESYETNDDATEWTFTIRDGLRFSDGSPVLPSSFARGWERATDPELADPAADVFQIIDGGRRKLDGGARTIAGLRADDDARMLEVRLAEPMATFDALVAFQLFMPVPQAVEALDDQREWENGEMVGNGPFVLAQPRSAAEVVLDPNPQWDGTRYDSVLRLPEQPFLQRLTLRAFDSPFDAYAAFEAGQGQVVAVPAGSFGEAQQRYRTTFDVAQVVSYYLQVDWQHPDLGGPENRLLRQAISQAIDREAINQLLHDGTSRIASGLTPPAYPGFSAGLCDYCQFDPSAARAAFESWLAEGNELAAPIRVQSPAPEGASDPVAPSIADDLQAVGIDAVVEPMVTDDYADRLAAGGCELCPLSGVLNYLSYDGFLAASFGTDSPFNHGGFAVDSFDRQITDARGTPDPDRRADLLHEAERQLLNEETGAIPVLWHTFGYAYTEQVADLPQTGGGLIIWERVYLDADADPGR